MSIPYSVSSKFNRFDRRDPSFESIDPRSLT